MLRISGCVLVIAAGAMFGWLRLDGLRQRCRALAAFAEALRRGSAELGTSLTPTGELMAMLAEGSNPWVSRFFASVRDDLAARGAPCFPECWQAAVDGCGILELPEQQALSALATVLGQYGAEETCAALDRCARQLETAGEEVLRRMPDAARLYLGISLTVSALLAIVLL